MKLLLFQFVVCVAAVLAAPADKQKRDILPGDPRYGTEHHHHHHHEHENEVQISKAAGGYVGTYTVPDDTADHSLQVHPKTSYGPPSITPGKPLGTDLFALSDADKTSASIFSVPATSYGIPDTTQVLNNYFGSVIDDQKTSVVKTTIQEEPKFDTLSLQKSAVIPEIHHEVHHVQPAVIHKHVESIPQSVSLPQVKVTASHLPTKTQGVVPSLTSSISSFPSYDYSSYSNIPVKTLDHHVQVQVPQPYQVPVTKHIAVPVPVPHTVEVPKPYYVRVPQPVQVTVDRPYPVEVPRPVPYPVPQYVKTAVPFSHHLTVDTKANPFQTFLTNSQTTFQNVLAGFPTFSSPFEGIQNPFENLDLTAFPPLSFIPPSSLPNIPFLPQPQPATVVSGDHVNVAPSLISDSVAVENPVLKTETTVTKPAIVKPIVTHHAKNHHTQSPYKPATACAGCTVTAAGSSKQEYVQPTDANGGYVY